MEDCLAKSYNPDTAQRVPETPPFFHSATTNTANDPAPRVSVNLPPVIFPKPTRLYMHQRNFSCHCTTSPHLITYLECMTPAFIPLPVRKEDKTEGNYDGPDKDKNPPPRVGGCFGSLDRGQSVFLCVVDLIDVGYGVAWGDECSVEAGLCEYVCRSDFGTGR